MTEFEAEVSELTAKALGRMPELIQLAIELAGGQPDDYNDSRVVYAIAGHLLRSAESSLRTTVQLAEIGDAKNSEKIAKEQLERLKGMGK
jgi:hypothetical protein